MTSSLPVAQNAVKEFKVDLRLMVAICFNSKMCFYATGKGKDKVSNKNATNFRLKVTFLLYIEIIINDSNLNYYFLRQAVFRYVHTSIEVTES